MDTFLHFYTTLVGFVNCKLYSMQNLHYPPKLNQERAKNDAGVSALIMEPANTAGEGSGSGSEEAGATKGAKAKKDKTAQRIASALANVDEGDGADEDEDTAADTATATAGEGEGAAAASLDSFPGQMSGGEDTVAELAAKTGANAEADKFSKLFDGLYFFLSREVPRYTLEFVIRSFGGQVSWQVRYNRQGCCASLGPRASGRACLRACCCAGLSVGLSVGPAPPDPRRLP